MRASIVAMFLLAGCSGESTGNDGPLATDLSLGADLASASTDLAAHYGNMVGDTFPMLVWEGYRDDLADAIATAKPYVSSYTTDDLHNSGKKYALVHISDFY